MVEELKLVDRTLDVLEALAAESQGFGVVRLAESLGEPAATIHRLLASLRERQYVIRDEATRRYKLGVGVLRLAQSYQQRDMVVAAARPHLVALREKTSESVFLSERIEDDVICVASAESPRPLSFYMRPGQRTPYHAASSARAILAFDSLDEQLRLLGAEKLEPFTRRTPTTVQDALAELVRTRNRGFAICDREMEAGIVALSVPLRGADGNVTASVTVVAPENRLGRSRRREVIELLYQTAGAIEAAVGFSAGPDARRTRMLAG